MAFVYSDDYFADIGIHVFPVIKYRLVYRKLVEEGGADPHRFIKPRRAARDELLLVHSREYLQDLEHCRSTPRTRYSELPLTREIIAMFTLAAGGTIVAAESALQQGWCVHLNGGFHHAFRDRAEGFCYLNDLAVAARVLQQKEGLARIAVIDCDLHQGNGTARIFQEDESVFTFSIHQRDLYPIKEKSDLDIHLPVHVGDAEYHALLQQALEHIFREFRPQFVLYQAGADPYRDDQLGRLSLTIEGLRKRDEMVVRQCREAGCPVAVTLGGGYAYNTDDTVAIHCNTCLTAWRIFTNEDNAEHRD